MPRLNRFHSSSLAPVRTSFWFGYCSSKLYISWKIDPSFRINPLMPSTRIVFMWTFYHCCMEVLRNNAIPRKLYYNMDMYQYDVDPIFNQLVCALEQESEEQKEVRRRAAFRVESRPNPEGLIPDGIPPGHVTFMGDFENPASDGLV